MSVCTSSHNFYTARASVQSVAGFNNNLLTKSRNVYTLLMNRSSNLAKAILQL